MPVQEERERFEKTVERNEAATESAERTVRELHDAATTSVRVADRAQKSLDRVRSLLRHGD